MADKPVDGDHAYVKPDTAEDPIVADVLLQSIVASEPASTDGVVLFTVTITVSPTLEHPVDAFVTTTVYAVVVSGEAEGCAAVEEDNPFVGVHA